MWRLVFLPLLLFVRLGLASEPPDPGVEAVLAQFAHEPSVAQVQQQAARHARVDAAEVDGWLAASRTFAALPELRVEYRVRDGWDKTFRYLSTSGAQHDPQATLFDVADRAQRDQDQTVVVRAAWDLDKLVMSPERIRVLRESQDAARQREKLLAEVTRLYFERRRLQVDLLLKPRSDLASSTRDALRLEELTALLDALTGGAFTDTRR